MSFWSRVSMVMLVLNERDRLAAALDSIPGETEKIVADGGSSDGSASTAVALGARVAPQDLDAVRAAQGNFDVARDAAARRYATRPWIFYLDADERVSPDLAAEIGGLDPATDRAGFDMPRVNLFWGRPVRLLGDDRQLRLFRAGRGAYPGTTFHEKVVVQGPVGRLRGALMHENVRSWKDVRRLQRYVPLEAGRWERRPSRLESWRAFDRSFSHYLITCGAWRDGWRGWTISAVYAAYRARILWEARRRHA